MTLIEETIRGGKETLVYSIARPEDVDEVVLMAIESFANSTPTKEIEAIDYPSSADAGLERLNSYRTRTQMAFAQPTSIIVREKSTNQVVGFMAMVIDERGSNSSSTYSIKSNDDRTSGWLMRALLAELNRDVNLYERYGTDTILSIKFGAVRKDYRGERVILYSKAYLALEAEIIAKYGAGAIRAQAFSHFFNLAATATGKNWETIKTIDYNTFEMPDGTRPLAGVDLGVHRSVRLFAARLHPIRHQQEDAKYFKSSL